MRAPNMIPVPVLFDAEFRLQQPGPETWQRCHVIGVSTNDLHGTRFVVIVDKDGLAWPEEVDEVRPIWKEEAA